MTEKHLRRPRGKRSDRRRDRAGQGGLNDAECEMAVAVWNLSHVTTVFPQQDDDRVTRLREVLRGAIAGRGLVGRRPRQTARPGRRGLLPPVRAPGSHPATSPPVDAIEFCSERYGTIWRDAIEKRSPLRHVIRPATIGAGGGGTRCGVVTRSAASHLIARTASKVDRTSSGISQLTRLRIAPVRT